MLFAVFLCKPVSRSHIVVCTYMHTPFICLRTSLSRPVSNDSQVGHMVTTAPEEVVAYYNRTHWSLEKIPSWDWEGMDRGRTLIHCQWKRIHHSWSSEQLLLWLQCRGNHATSVCLERTDWPLLQSDTHLRKPTTSQLLASSSQTPNVLLDVGVPLKIQLW